MHDQKSGLGNQHEQRPVFVGRMTSARRIIAAVAREHGLPAEAILSRSKSRAIVSARRDAVRRVRAAVPSLTREQIGALFGRDASTISYLLGMTQRSVEMEPRVELDPVLVGHATIPVEKLVRLFLGGSRRRTATAALVGAYPGGMSPAHLIAVIGGGAELSNSDFSDVLSGVRKTIERHGWTTIVDVDGSIRLVGRPA